MNLPDLLKRYESALRGLGVDVLTGYSLPPAAAHALLWLIYRVGARVIEDQGAGFSTIALRASLPLDYQVFTTEHDDDWRDSMVIVIDQLAHEGIPLLRPSCSLGPLHQGIESRDLIFVDHGPTMQSRVDGLSRSMDRAPFLVLDDWRGRYKDQAAAVLASRGWSSELIPGTRICFASRPKG